MVRGNNNNNTREVVNFLDDSSHPLYLLTGDNQGPILVSEQLTKCNYHDWSKSLLTSLTAKNKVGFVDGSLLKPETNDPYFNNWIRCNSMVVSWIRNSVTSEIRSSLFYLDSAHDIWKDLRERFSQGDLARIYQLKQHLMSLNQGALDVNTYYTKLRIIWDEYKGFQPINWCHCGGCRCNSAKLWNEYLQRECILHFLMGLNESYSLIRSQMLQADSLPSPSKVFSLVIQEERQRSEAKHFC